MSEEKTKEVSSQPKDWGDITKWIVVALLVGLGVWGNSYYADQSVLYRVLALLVLACVAAYIAYLTKKGRSFWDLVQGSRTEIRRVVWPSRQETNTTTMVVIAFTVVMGLILWLLDSGFGWLVSKFIG